MPIRRPAQFSVSCRRYCLAAAVLLPSAPLFSSPSGAAENAAEVRATEARLYEAVKFLASDELEGRGVGTKGLDRAAEFIAEQFVSLDLKTSLLDG